MANAIALQGFSSARPLSFIVLCLVLRASTYSLSRLIPMGSSPIGLHSMHPTASLPFFYRSPRPPAAHSYSDDHSDMDHPFKCDAQVVLHPVTPLFAHAFLGLVQTRIARQTHSRAVQPPQPRPNRSSFGRFAMFDLFSAAYPVPGGGGQSGCAQATKAQKLVVIGAVRPLPLCAVCVGPVTF